jgi:hypothetical protein
LGWKKDDILLVTDFPYEYKGIKSLEIDDGVFYKFDKTSNKIPVILHLFEHNTLEKDVLYWYHDFDVHPLEVIRKDELGLDDFDLGITPYGYKPEWNLGSIFFKTSAIDIFKLINEDIMKKRRSDNRCDEKALRRLIVNRKVGKNRYRDLNVTYNFAKKCIATNYRNADKPLKVVHFHLWDKDAMMSDTALNLFMYGKNRLKTPLMNKRLINIFETHGVR